MTGYTVGPSLRAAAHQFRAAVDATAGLGHPLTTGEMRERRVAELLRPLIPARYALMTEIVVNALGQASRQQDLVLVDSVSASLFSVAGDHAVAPIEGTPASIQVKTNASPGDVADAVENLASFKSLLNDTPRESINQQGKLVTSSAAPWAGVVCLQSKSSPESILESYVEANRGVEPRLRTNALLVASEFAILWMRDPLTNERVWEPERATRAGLLHVGEFSTGLFLFSLLE